MKDWEVTSALQELQGFAKPKIELEQYLTPPELASHFVCAAERTYGDVDGKVVMDLGCGTGMLSCGAALLGADAVVGCDIDDDALALAHENREELDLEDVIDFVRLDVTYRKQGENDGTPILPQFRIKFDTIFLNPPFGANKDRQQKGIDLLFLHTAVSMVKDGGAVYSLHKSSTREHIQQTGDKWGVTAEALGEYTWNLGKTYKHQKKNTKDISVDMWRFAKKKKIEAK